MQTGKVSLSNKNLNKTISEALIGLKLIIPGNSCDFAICRVFFLYREMGLYKSFKKYLTS